MTDQAEGAVAGLPGDSTGHWVLDPGKSSVTISSKTFWGLATVRGSFADLSGEADVAADGSVSATLVIGAASVNTRNGTRDTHLRSADFFKADEHPSIVFTASEAKPGPAGGLAVAGTLEAAGVSQPLSFPARIAGQAPGEATVTADVQVDRTAHGMTWNRLGMVGRKASASVVAHFTRQPAS